MRTIAILNLKGGVGKTVTSINMAAILAADHKQRVLLIDADSQCNTTEFFGGISQRGSLADLLTANSVGYAGPYIQPTAIAEVDLLPASDELMDLDLSKIENKTVRSTALRELTQQLASDFDYAIIDCPPAFNAASAAALVAADDVIIPIKLDAFSLRGMVNLMRQVNGMKQINPRLRIAGCLPTMFYVSEQMKNALALLSKSNLPKFKCAIRRSPKVDDMTFAQEPLCIYSPRSSAGIDYRKFVSEYLADVRGGADNG